MLECERLESPQPIAAEDVETIVKKAVSYTDEDKGKRKINKKFLPVYCISLVIAVGQLCVLPFILANGSDIYQAIQLTIFFHQFLAVISAFSQRKSCRLIMMRTKSDILLMGLSE